jgi:hypothetical protein
MCYDINKCFKGTNERACVCVRACVTSACLLLRLCFMVCTHFLHRRLTSADIFAE